MATESSTTADVEKLEKKLIKDEVTGLWTNEKFMESYVDEPKFDLRSIHIEAEFLNKSGIEKSTNKYKSITTLHEKAKSYSISEVALLAGIAKKNNNNAFAKVEKNVKEITDILSKLVYKMQEINNQVNNLKEMAVID